MKDKLKKNKVLLTIASIFVGLLLLSLIPVVREWFFDESNLKPEKIVGFIGISCGGIILLWQLAEANKRNVLTQREQVDTRFRDASILLSSDSTSSIISGIYALHRIAEEVHAGDKSQRGYVRIIHDILCAYVRESAQDIAVGEENRMVVVASFKEMRDDYYQKDFPKEPVEEKPSRICTRPTIVIQTIMDVLFDNNKDIYAEYRTDLSGCVLEYIDVSYKRISNTVFTNSRISNSTLDFATIYNTKFSNSILENASAHRSQFTSCHFAHSHLIDWRSDAIRFIETNFYKTQISNMLAVDARIVNSTYTYSNIIDNSIFRDVYIENSEYTATHIANSVFSGASIIHSKFYEAHIDNSFFIEVNIKSDSSFEKATITKSDFSLSYIDVNTSFKRAVIGEGVEFPEDFDIKEYQ